LKLVITADGDDHPSAGAASSYTVIVSMVLKMSDASSVIQSDLDRFGIGDG
jgi:hypothetical protein